MWFNFSLFCSKANDTCGGMITDRSGLITAPDYDADGYYDFNVACDWFIKVANNSVIAYQVVNIEIGAVTTTVSSCERDELRVRDVLRVSTLRARQILFLSVPVHGHFIFVLNRYTLFILTLQFLGLNLLINLFD